MPVDRDPNYADWDVRGGSEGSTYIGVTTGGVPVFYEEPTGELYGASLDEEQREVVREESGPTIEPTETLGEAIERVGDELGWESLSKFAQDHLESDSGSDEAGSS